MIEFAEWLQSTPPSVALQATSWAIPLLQSIHILMIGIVFMSIVMVTLRVLGKARTDQSLEHVWTRFAPWLWAALVTMLFTGFLLIVAEPVREFTSTSFWLKMVLLVVAIGSAAAFARALAAGSVHVQPVSAPAAPPRVRLAAAATVLVWIAIIFLGRAIAYDIEVWGALSLAAQG